MFDYELKGRQVVLALSPEGLEALKPMGVPGTPLLAVVHAMEDDGLWLENPAFPLCPPGRPRLARPDGSLFCRAHVFVPRGAILSLAVFPEPVDFDEEAEVHRIGFRPKEG